MTAVALAAVALAAVTLAAVTLAAVALPAVTTAFAMLPLSAMAAMPTMAMDMMRPVRRVSVHYKWCHRPSYIVTAIGRVINYCWRHINRTRGNDDGRISTVWVADLDRDAPRALCIGGCGHCDRSCSQHRRHDSFTRNAINGLGH